MGRDAFLYESIKRISFMDLKGKLLGTGSVRTVADLVAPVPTQCMQAAKIRTPKSIEAYTGNLVMKIQVSWWQSVECRSADQVQSKLGGVTHQVPLSDLPGMVRGKTMLLGGNLGFVS